LWECLKDKCNKRIYSLENKGKDQVKTLKQTRQARDTYRLLSVKGGISYNTEKIKLKSGTHSLLMVEGESY